MKVTDYDYSRLVAAVGEDMPLDATERERWDTLWAAVDGGRLSYSTLSAYTDAHIDTALRRIARG